MNTIFSQAPVAICILKGETFQVEWANERYLELIDKDQQFIGKKLFNALPELEGQGIREMLNGVLETGNPYIGNELEVYLYRNGKREKTYFNFVYQPLRENGFVSGIIVVCFEVTSIVDSKNRLKESENRFRNLIEHSPIPMTIFNGPDFIIDSANDALLKKIWKKEWSEVKGKKLLDVFPELKSQQFPKLLKEVYESGILYKENEAIAHVQSATGMNTFYLDFEYAPLFDTEKKVFAIMVTVNDVTEKVEARKRIADAEERARLAIDSSELGTFDLNTVTNEMICSSRYFEIFGFNQPVPREKCIEKFHPDDLHIRDEAFERAKEKDKLLYEMRILKQPNEIAWIRIEGKIFYDENGQPNRILGTLRDITERKKNEEELKLSFEKFRFLADSMPQFVWTGTPEGELNYFNQSVFTYSGLSIEQILKEGWLQIVHPNDREENMKKWMYSIQTGNDFWMEHRFRRHDGVYRWQLSRAIPQKNDSGAIQMWVGTSTDIHDQKTSSQKLEELVEERTKELKQVNVELESMNQELASFAYISSHDLQEPLRKIQTFADRILESESGNLSEQGKNYFTRMQNAANRMQKLINDLLTYSRANSEERVFEKTDLNS
ncbi:MAG TPA: PAS domain S-box protein, partial [Chitinophagales bacterium]|nr:PAS domain S-box protein [Chitinophagales bacterium]